MNVVEALQGYGLGSPTTVNDLSVFPLLARDLAEPRYLTLDEAVVAQLADVTEVTEEGSVGQLRVTNRADRPVLILDGEELVGAKQNRIVNLTILIAAHSTLHIPVTCVEAGRWRYRSQTFTPAGRTHYASARAMKLGQVTESLAADGMRRADQHAVWAHIAQKAARLEAPSDTQAAAAMYERLRPALEDLVKAFPPAPMQIGAVFAIRQRVVGLEMFDSPLTWRKQAAKVIRGYGLDALDSGTAGGYTEDPREFIDAVASAAVKTSPAIGLGTDIRFEGRGFAGAALVLDGTVVHALAFAGNF